MPKVKKVISIAPLSGVTGGIQKWAKNIVSYSQSLQNNDVELITFDFSRKRSGQMAENMMIRVLSFLIDYWRLTIHAAKCIKETDADIVHISTPSGVLLLKDLYLIHQAHKYGKKAYVHFHFGRIPDLFKHGGWELRLLKRVLHQANHVVVMDRFSFETLKKHGFDNVTNIPNPLSPETLLLANKYKTEKKSGTILFAGHVIPTKGVEELILSTKNITGITVKIIGAVSDIYKEHLIQLAGNGHENWLQISGEASYDATIQEMCRCDLFVLPTYTEGFPNVILESMATGCCIIASKVGAIPEMLGVNNLEITKQAGLCIEPRDVTQLEEAIREILSNHVVAEQLRQNAINRVLSEYEISIVWNKLIDLWKL